MNFIGKSLVLIYGTVSLFCLILATAVYTQKMNFVTPKGEDPRKLPPLVEESIKKTKELLIANNRAYTRWVQNYDDLAKLEVEHFQRLGFYDRQLELARTGELDGKIVEEPIQVLAYDETALKQTPPARKALIDKPTGREAEKVPPGAPAKTPHSYIVAIDKADEEKISLEKQTREAEHKTLADSIAINGSPDLALTFEKLEKMEIDAIKKLLAAALGLEAIDKNFVKGLRERIKEQEDIAKIADEERLYLEDPITTRRADAELFVKRRDALKSRIARLEEYFGKKKGGQGN